MGFAFELGLGMALLLWFWLVTRLFASLFVFELVGGVLFKGGVVR